MRRLIIVLGMVGSCVFNPGTSHGNQVLQDFNNQGFDLSYGSWIPLNNSQTLFTSYVQIGNTATSNGGAGMDVIQLDISAYTDVVLDARLDPSNVATTLNLVFYDNDGTEAKYTFNTSRLNTATFTSLQVPFSAFTLTIAGSGPGLDLAHITEWDIEGSQSGTDLFAMQFDQIQVIPEPGMGALGSVVAVSMLLRCRRR